MYVINTNERIATIRSLAKSGDMPALAKEAHTLIGTSGNVGADRASEMAAMLEAACKAGKLAEAMDGVAALDGAVTAAMDAILAWLAARFPAAEPPERAEAV
jgi:HPt (histidine-containing phosphotransfer) domain-containing protein